jgi:hypothetical protein
MSAGSGPELDRRSLLAAAGAVPLSALLAAGLAGCTADPPPPPPPGPDDVRREEAAARERALLAEYDAVLLVLPALAPRLAPLRAEHAAHLGALTGASPSPSATAGRPSPASSTVPPPQVPPPDTAAAALEALAVAERVAASAHGKAALDASPELAGLLASLSASELSHPVALA